MALFGLKYFFPARGTRQTETAIEMLFLTPGSDNFFEFREPRFLWKGARFGAEVAASDF
jgi:hypothetical protein